MLAKVLDRPGEIPPPDQVLSLHPSFFSYELAQARPSSGDKNAPDGWLEVLIEAFMRSHRSEGHHVFAFEPEFMGLSLQRAGILGDFSSYLHRQATWLATLGDVSDWWSKRRHVSVEFGSPEPGLLDIVVHNEGATELDGVSLDVTLDAARSTRVDMSSRQLVVSKTVTEDGLVAVIEKLPPGTHIIRLSEPLRTPAAEGSEQE